VENNRFGYCSGGWCCRGSYALMHLRDFAFIDLKCLVFVVKNDNQSCAKVGKGADKLLVFWCVSVVCYYLIYKRFNYQIILQNNE